MKIHSVNTTFGGVLIIQLPLRFMFSLGLLLTGMVQAQIPDVVQAFLNIPAKLKVYKFSSRYAPPFDGHLQGIQGWSLNGQEYALITGSSATYSYYTIVSLTDSQKVLSLNKIADSPLRHAGGCQLAEGRLLVGIEDNYERNRSEIVALKLSDSLPEVDGSTTAIMRQGKRDRHTAGATGFVKQNDSTYIAAVGDWDSRNIDFYRSQGSTPLQFELFATLSMDSAAMQGLTTLLKWPAYQSINLLADNKGLYVVGFAKDSGKNRADLYTVVIKGNQAFLEAAATRHFKCTPGVSFRYGAGIRVNNGKLQVYACQRNLAPINVVNVFGE
jgi:hypothetical protein